MHKLSTTFVLGYHGCDKAVGERLLNNEPFEPSENGYDWLGSGIYFWETNPDRALDWARQQAKRKTREEVHPFEPFVVGAIIDLGFCLDLISSNGIAALKQAHEDLVATAEEVPFELPVNAVGDDLLLRRLDCAVINYLHTTRDERGQSAFDTVRGVFTEGPRLYTNSGFWSKTHIQLCVRSREMVKGVFRVSSEHFTSISS